MNAATDRESVRAAQQRRDDDWAAKWLPIVTAIADRMETSNA